MGGRKGKTYRTSPCSERPSQSGGIFIDGRLLAIGHEARPLDNCPLISIWEVAAKRIQSQIPSTPIALAFTADGHRLVLGGLDIGPVSPTIQGPVSVLNMWNISKSVPERSFVDRNQNQPRPALSPVLFAVSPDAKRLVAHSQTSNDQINVSDMNNGQVISTFKHRSGRISALAFTVHSNNSVTVATKGFTCSALDFARGLKQSICERCGYGLG